jgi:hypothetical protein
VSKADWWGTDGRAPREFAEALLQMRGEPDRQKNFVETHVPEHIRDIVRDHYRTAIALGGKE